MKNPLTVGVTTGAAFSTWSLMTMLLPVSYRTWDIGRSVLFVAFAVTLVRPGASRSRASAMSPFGAVAVACFVAAGLTLVGYAVLTAFFAPWPVFGTARVPGASGLTPRRSRRADVTGH